MRSGAPAFDWIATVHEAGAASVKPTVSEPPAGVTETVAGVTRSAPSVVLRTKGRSAIESRPRSSFAVATQCQVPWVSTVESGFSPVQTSVYVPGARTWAVSIGRVVPSGSTRLTETVDGRATRYLEGLRLVDAVAVRGQLRRHERRRVDARVGDGEHLRDGLLGGRGPVEQLAVEREGARLAALERRPDGHPLLRERLRQLEVRHPDAEAGQSAVDDEEDDRAVCLLADGGAGRRPARTAAEKSS